ncbi:hypothetical protein GCM10007162_09100 [Ignatzschineria ureiclastica]|nr:hypothetical protein GCM10007162_09100 [Ignatzschineria ureiclastica]
MSYYINTQTRIHSNIYKMIYRGILRSFNNSITLTKAHLIKALISLNEIFSLNAIRAPFFDD